jgi:hypothetical protein
MSDKNDELNNTKQELIKQGNNKNHSKSINLICEEKEKEKEKVSR